MSTEPDQAHCADNALYVGETRSVVARVLKHEAGEASGFTRTRRPVTLVYAEEHRDRLRALAGLEPIRETASLHHRAAAIARTSEFSRHHPRRDIALPVENTPHGDVVIAFDVEDQVWMALHRRATQTGQMQFERVARRPAGGWRPLRENVYPRASMNPSATRSPPS